MQKKKLEYTELNFLGAWNKTYWHFALDKNTLLDKKKANKPNLFMNSVNSGTFFFT